MLLEAGAQLLLAEYVAQEVNGKHLHDFDVPLVLRPQELVGNFCHSICPEHSVGDKHVRARVYELLANGWEDGLLEQGLSCAS